MTRRKGTYVKRFMRWSESAEKALVRTAAVLFALLIVAQLLLQAPYMRRMLTRVERLEGDPMTAIYRP